VQSQLQRKVLLETFPTYQVQGDGHTILLTRCTKPEMA